MRIDLEKKYTGSSDLISGSLGKESLEIKYFFIFLRIILISGGYTPAFWNTERTVEILKVFILIVSKSQRNIAEL